MTASFDICVRGAGPVGRCLALALARQGWQVAWSRPAAAAQGAAREDLRAYALGAPAVELLRRLRVWDALPAGSVTPVTDMRIQGDRGGHLEFTAWQQCVDALSWIVDAAELDRVLADAMRFAPHVTAVDHPVPARLQAVCEGRDAASRAAFGVRFEWQDYGQHGLAARLVSDRPHGGVAWQWFRSPDILALLPFDRPEGAHSFALVWSQPAAQALAWREAEPAAFEAALMDATGGAAGTLRLAGGRASWPLGLGRAERWCGDGWVLLGDAAHVVHPLAGQGLNLGLGDVITLSALLEAARAQRADADPADARLLRRYARERLLPTRAMGGVTDGLLHLFAHDAPVLRELRNHGLTLLDRLPPLKRWLAGRALEG
jgi:2-polyprenyl-6-methoxyphenol hydroxylase-like FAD-dependent oxidoreductase